MNYNTVIVLFIEVCCILSVSGMAIRKSDEHQISKRSTSADHSITDAKGRHRENIHRQFILSKLLRAVDTSGSRVPSEVIASMQKESTTVTPTVMSTRQETEKKVPRRRGGRGRGRKSKQNGVPRSVKKSIEVLLRSEYADEIINSIDNIVEKDGSLKKAAARVRKFIKKCSNSNL
ncbi:uncharacterized protein LOC120346155 [Styela clava]|uniref:uncharacterized protein LOC120346155 n=1 Tax=Styela clava TaxID=7725 RepID=UPI00193A8047|nr:uncharacterized protein LOC120346155 [Styela clava]